MLEMCTVESEMCWSWGAAIYLPHSELEFGFVTPSRTTRYLHEGIPLPLYTSGTVCPLFAEMG